MPRTTLDIDETVLRELKRRQRGTGKTLGRLVSELLAGALAAAEPDEAPFAWSTAAMHARIDLEDKDALFGLLDRTQPPS